MDPVGIDKSSMSWEYALADFQREITAPTPELKHKIVVGKLYKWSKDNLLLSMPWVKDNSKTIGDLLTDLCTQLGENVKVLRFVRYGE